MIKKLTSLETALETGRLFVQVTCQDIDSAECMSDSRCAVATALRRMYGGRWSVGTYNALCMTDDEDRLFQFPQPAADWVRRFDRGGQMQPIEFVAVEDRK